MKLLDLEPHWLSPDMFIFRNPTTRTDGRRDWLTCKRVAMGHKEQYILAYGHGVWDDATETKTKWTDECVVLCADGCVWEFKGDDFNTLTVTPSIDASKSGNWHGFITNGEIV
jgi:hypothetical protein